jgi:8-oxo-dGTP pyrophosphatase MutT (NUDIX family)
MSYTDAMGHIHTEPGDHDHTVSAFIVREDFDEPKLLLHMHKKLHVLLQIGGHVEVKENPWSAIEHEILEESGYTFKQLQLLQPLDRLGKLSNATLHPYPVVMNTHNFDPAGTHKHIDTSYAFVTSEEPGKQPDDGESTDIRWLSLTELQALDETAVFENVREIGAHVLSTIYSQWERIPADQFSAA